MPALAKAGDPTTGHATYPPTTVSGGSGKVSADGVAVLSVANVVHDGHTNTVKPYDFHQGSGAAGSSKVFIEGSPALRIGDTLTCGDTIAGGSGKTNGA